MTLKNDKMDLKSSTKLPPIVVIPIEARGGVGKSTKAHIAQLVLRDDDVRVHVVDTDRNNSTQRMFSDAVELDMSRQNFEGNLLSLTAQHCRREFKHLVFDLAAGEERQMRMVAREMAEAVAKAGGMFVAIRPVTACGFVQDNIKTFAENVMTKDMRVLLVKNLARVDDVEDFARWNKSATRAAIIARGAVEIDLENAGIALNDRLIQYRLSFDALAHGRFDESKYAAKARAEFTEADQLSVARWLKRQKAVFHDAFVRLAAK